MTANIRKILAFASFLLLIVGTVSAQKGYKIGLYGIPQYTVMYNSDDQSAPVDSFGYQKTFGMSVGPVLGYNFSEHWGIRVNPLYSVQGQKWTWMNVENELVTSTLRLHYVKLPIMFGFNTNTEFNNVWFNFHLGPQISYLVSAKYYDDDESYTPDETLNRFDYPSVRDRYSNFQIGAAADFGVDIKLTYNLAANVHLRGDFMFTDAENKSADYKELVSGIVKQKDFYADERAKTYNITGGLVLGLTYSFTVY